MADLLRTPRSETPDTANSQTAMFRFHPTASHRNPSRQVRELQPGSHLHHEPSDLTVGSCEKTRESFRIFPLLDLSICHCSPGPRIAHPSCRVQAFRL